MSGPSAIAHYRITSMLGQGGMGVVYRATDTKLGREVAIKVLPDSFASDPDRLARFAREAQVLASLNHPNIAAVYGVEERAIVMELIEGDDLRGPLPIATALSYARQIAEALESAHEKGIVHRDLKPANVKVTPDGVVKVLDFGLAKAVMADEPSTTVDPHNSPTLTFRATTVGLILGTAAYMSPEQAAGKPVDKRSDIWSFGVVLWEMLTGARLFEAETVSHTLADVLRGPIDLGKLPAETPPAVRMLIARCLEREVKKRLRDIGEARILLESPQGVSSTPEPPRAARPWRLIAAAAILFTLAALALAIVHFRETPPEARLVRSSLQSPEGTQLNVSGSLASVGPPALSPDGRRVVFGVRKTGAQNHLWVRSMDAVEAQPLPGTEGATHPFWSPDSRYIGFFAGDQLKKVDFAGGQPLVLSDAPGGRGGTWNHSGLIVFGGFGIGGGGLYRVSDQGGTPMKVDLDVGGRWPWFLPDGNHFLYSAGSTIRVGSLSLSQTKAILETTSDAEYAQGNLLYLRDKHADGPPV